MDGGGTGICKGGGEERLRDRWGEVKGRRVDGEMW